MVQAPPRTLQLLKFLRMHDLVQLSREQFVDLGDTGIDGRFDVTRKNELPLHDLLNKLANHVLRRCSLNLRSSHLALIQNFRKEINLSLLFLNDGLGFGSFYLLVHLDSSLVSWLSPLASRPNWAPSVFWAELFLRTSCSRSPNLSLPSILDSKSERRCRP